MFGRRLYLPEINARNAPRRQYAERSAINAPMQGTAADIIKRAMIDVAAWLEQQPPGARLIMQVHDELVIEVPERHADEVGAAVARIMEAAASLRVPLRGRSRPRRQLGRSTLTAVGTFPRPPGTKSAALRTGAPAILPKRGFEILAHPAGVWCPGCVP